MVTFFCSLLKYTESLRVYQLSVKQLTLNTLWFLIDKVKKGDVNACKALLDSAYGAVKQSVEIKEGEIPIFKQLDIDVIDDQ